MKIRLGLQESDWHAIVGKLHDFDIRFLENDTNNSVWSDSCYAEIKLGELIYWVISKYDDKCTNAFISYLNQKNYAKVSHRNILNIKQAVAINLPSYKLAKSVFIKVNELDYINYAAYKALQIESQKVDREAFARTNLAIVEARLAIHHQDSDTANAFIEELEEKEWEDCSGIIQAYNIYRLKLKLENLTISPTKDSSNTNQKSSKAAYGRRFSEIFRISSCVKHIQFIIVFYQLKWGKNYIYLRQGGISTWKRSKLAITVAGVLALAGMLLIAALLIVSHGIAFPLLASLGSILLNLVAAKTLFTCLIVFTAISLFSLLAEIAAPNFNRLFFNNLFFSPYGLAKHLSKDYKNIFAKVISGFAGIVLGLVYHPFYMLFHLGGSIHANFRSFFYKDKNQPIKDFNITTKPAVPALSTQANPSKNDSSIISSEVKEQSNCYKLTSFFRPIASKVLYCFSNSTNTISNSTQT